VIDGYLYQNTDKERGGNVGDHISPVIINAMVSNICKWWLIITEAAHEKTHYHRQLSIR
jgi:hypothetical protein